MSKNYDVTRATDCPKCDSYAKRYGSYHAKNGTFRRYRKCGECGHEFITVEQKEEPVNDQPKEEESSGSEDFLADFEEDLADPRGG